MNHSLLYTGIIKNIKHIYHCNFKSMYTLVNNLLQTESQNESEVPVGGRLYVDIILYIWLHNYYNNNSFIYIYNIQRLGCFTSHLPPKEGTQFSDISNNYIHSRCNFGNGLQKVCVTRTTSNTCNWYWVRETKLFPARAESNGSCYNLLFPLLLYKNYVG